MDYKEKYEHALRVAKETYNKQPMYREWLGKMFPELKESEDEKVRQKILFLFYAWRNNEQVNIPNKKEVEKTITWLEKQGEKVEPKSVWSEEDEENMEKILDAIGSYYYLTTDDDILCNWLKSLRPQNRWKPSDEQMKALNYVVNLMASSESPKENDYYYNVFKDMRKQLKKLKEE